LLDFEDTPIPTMRNRCYLRSCWVCRFILLRCLCRA